MKVGFHPAADIEVHAAAAHYESRVQGLGAEFVEELERQCALLGEHPSVGGRYDAGKDEADCDGPNRVEWAVLCAVLAEHAA
jgi:hypothetical protein